jgi:hypothetical protein
MTTIIDGSGSATFATPLPMSQVADLGLPAYGRVVRTAGSITTTSTSSVDVTGATVTFTTGAFPVAYGATHTAKNNTSAGYQVYFNIDVDGVLEFGAIGLFFSAPVADYGVLASFSGQTVALSAATHTIKEVWHTTAGTATIFSDTNRSAMFYAHEVR